MERLLAAHPCDRAGVLLRLAWRAGLTRNEIVSLAWEQTDLSAALLRMPEREIPLDEETVFCLDRWRTAQGKEKRVMPIAPQSVSRLARQMLDEEGQTQVRLIDLRLDFVRRLLREHDWPYVLRVSGFSVTTYRLVLAQLAGCGASAGESGYSAEEEELRLWKVLQTERGTPAGIALRLSRDLGMRAEEITSMTWDEVDLESGVLHLARGDVPMTQSARSVLASEKSLRLPEDDPHVLLSPRARKPMDAARLSTLVRGALIRGDLEDRSLSDIRGRSEREEAQRRILEYVREHGVIMRSDVTKLLDVSDNKAHERLRELVESGELTRVKARYYLCGTVVPAERQTEAVLDYIARYGTAYRQDIAELLHIAPRQAARVLKRMVDEGLLVRPEGSRRYMPAPKD